MRRPDRPPQNFQWQEPHAPVRGRSAGGPVVSHAMQHRCGGRWHILKSHGETLRNSLPPGYDPGVTTALHPQRPRAGREAPIDHHGICVARTPCTCTRPLIRGHVLDSPHGGTPCNVRTRIRRAAPVTANRSRLFDRRSSAARAVLSHVVHRGLVQRAMRRYRDPLPAPTSAREGKTPCNVKPTEARSDGTFTHGTEASITSKFGARVSVPLAAIAQMPTWQAASASGQNVSQNLMIRGQRADGFRQNNRRRSRRPSTARTISIVVTAAQSASG
jgi:hypothetical protein